MRLQNQVALISGGGSGIGQAIAEHFAQAGAQIVIADRNQAHAQRTAQAIIGGVALALPVDVVDGGLMAGNFRMGQELLGDG
jgi:3-hydroxybutyrate dehydrogenase